MKMSFPLKFKREIGVGELLVVISACWVLVTDHFDLRALKTDHERVVKQQDMSAKDFLSLAQTCSAAHAQIEALTEALNSRPFRPPLPMRGRGEP